MAMEKNLDPNDEKLKMLAEKAANLVDVPEIDINVTVSFLNIIPFRNGKILCKSMYSYLNKMDENFLIKSDISFLW